MLKQVLTMLMILMMAFSADALFEIRGGYGINTPADDSAELQGGGALGLSTMTGFHGDVIVSPPMIPFGFGLRYESMGLDIESAGQEFETDLTRMSVIVNYRLIDTLVFVGLIGTIGFSNEVSVSVPGFADTEYDADLTYSVGGEAGVSLGLIFVGAELGYSIADYEAKSATSDPQEVDFSGIYGKAFVGIGF